MSAAARLLMRAERYLASATVLIEVGDFESAVSRAYYAMFYAARAALGERGIAPRTHSGVVSEFGRVFVTSGEVERVYLTDLARALNDRLLAEYDEDLTFTQTQAERIRVSAEAFVERVRVQIG